MKRLCILFFCFIFLLTVLNGCGEDEHTVKELSAARDSGSLRIGVMVCPPFTYRIDGEWSGFDISLARDVCEKLGLEAEFVEVEWENKYSALNNGEVDCLWCGTSANSSLVEEVSFSQTYLTSRPVLLVRPTAPAALTLTAESDSVSFLAAQDCSLALKVLPAASCVDAVSMVMAGKADGAVVDALYANALVNGELQVSGDVDLGMEELAVMFRRGSDLVTAVNRAFSELERSGALNNLAERYNMVENLIMG